MEEWFDFERRSRVEKSSLNAMTENSMQYLEKVTDAVRAERRVLLFEDLQKQIASARQEQLGQNSVQASARMRSQRNSLAPLAQPLDYANQSEIV